MKQMMKQGTTSTNSNLMQETIHNVPQDGVNDSTLEAIELFTLGYSRRSVTLSRTLFKQHLINTSILMKFIPARLLSLSFSNV